MTQTLAVREGQCDQKEGAARMYSSVMTAPPALLTVEEAAERLRIGRTTMYALVSTGAIKSVTIGRLRRIPSECVSEYVTALVSEIRHQSDAA
jgi:excisionase family DNA binding protein